MTADWLFILTVVSALGCALMAGVFFAFSNTIMNALARLPPAQGMAAMQSINVAVLNPLFLTLFLGTAAACALLAVWSVVVWDRSGAAARLAGSLVYLIGAFLVTIACNVPRNNALAAAAPASVEGERLWAGYLTSWTAWNHVRTGASLAAAAVLTVGM